MNGLDWFLTLVAIFCVVRGLWRGAISQIFGIAGALGGFILASHFYQTLGLQLSRAFPQLPGPQAVSFAVLYVLTWFSVTVAGYWAAKLLRSTGLGFLDRILGAAVGLGKALILSIILISALTFFLPPSNPLLFQSCMISRIQEAAAFVVRATPENVQKLFEQKRNELKRYWPDGKPGGKGEKKIETQPNKTSNALSDVLRNIPANALPQGLLDGLQGGKPDGGSSEKTEGKEQKGKPNPHVKKEIKL